MPFMSLVKIYIYSLIKLPLLRYSHTAKQSVTATQIPRARTCGITGSNCPRHETNRRTAPLNRGRSSRNTPKRRRMCLAPHDHSEVYFDSLSRVSGLDLATMNPDVRYRTVVHSAHADWTRHDHATFTELGSNPNLIYEIDSTLCLGKERQKRAFITNSESILDEYNLARESSTTPSPLLHPAASRKPSRCTFRTWTAVAACHDYFCSDKPP